MINKRSDLAGPGISTYDQVREILPKNYKALLPPLERMEALYRIKTFMEDSLASSLNLQMVQVPLVVRKDSGVNDYLDRDGSRTPVDFPAGLGLPRRMEAQVVQAATKWKRMALAQFDCAVGQGINTDMRAIRKDYFLDHDHSVYVDQWDWEKRITASDRNLNTLKSTVRKLWNIIRDAGRLAADAYPELKDSRYPGFPEKLTFIHAEELLDMYPDLPRKERETRILQEYPAVFIIGIGSVLRDGYPHEMRAADYDDWITPTIEKNGQQMHGLNGDILVWNPVTQRRHELSSMGIRVTKDTLKKQLKLSGQEEFLALPYHQAILNDEIPLSIGGGIGQARTYMYLLRTAHLGEVTVSIWPDELKKICAEKNIRVLE